MLEMMVSMAAKQRLDFLLLWGVRANDDDLRDAIQTGLSSNMAAFHAIDLWRDTADLSDFSASNITDPRLAPVQGAAELSWRDRMRWITYMDPCHSGYVIPGCQFPGCQYLVVRCQSSEA